MESVKEECALYCTLMRLGFGMEMVEVGMEIEGKNAYHGRFDLGSCGEEFNEVYDFMKNLLEGESFVKCTDEEKILSFIGCLPKDYFFKSNNEKVIAYIRKKKIEKLF